MEAQKKRESMKIVPPGKKKCVWMEAGVVSYKLCDNNYDCPTCVYDQGMQLKVAKQSQAAAEMLQAGELRFGGHHSCFGFGRGFDKDDEFHGSRLH